ncbi:hypothetical protein N865_05340 [Intrasporangium oryzae NRRL B-24470]|uniref:HXXEE domain-containing protein n=1 Tax=Intrasporangium oryzae NRRL B-24470 TaxID=1386089 RepID=W9GCI8_9MICO|nr:HXXEE domain-containing protein [Intrasporangium oryzae]EWT02508.1 hypothetical protein N865_05340 [Intrasporangium oryzae NRRL B-24470]
MRWYLRHWYDVGLLVGVLALAWGVVADLDTRQQILLLSFGVLILHEFEEYGWPGGLPTFMNEVMRPSDRPDRYPLNQLNSMVINVSAVYLFYGIAIFFPDVIWLGLAPILFNFLEVLLHVGGGVIRARAKYSPGLVSVIPWAALSVGYIVEVNNDTGIAASDWWLAIGYMIAFVVIFLALVTYVWLADKNSPYPFDDVEMSRFEKYRHLVGAAHPH